MSGMPPAPPVYKATSHVLHLVMCFITFGFWAPVWLTVTLVNNSNNRSKQAMYERQYAMWCEYQARQQAALTYWQAQQFRQAVQPMYPQLPR